MCREKASKVAPLCLTGRFLWAGLGVKTAELRRFLAFFEAILGNLQSRLRGGAGSLELTILWEIPVNREIYRDFSQFWYPNS